jgi:glucosamine--fructose-6-phosphate aminotransferase (isomerizing)
MKGAKILGEISASPSIYSQLITAQSTFTAAANLIKSREIQVVMIVARGTSGNAGYFLKHLIETELGLPVGIAAPAAVSIDGAKLRHGKTLTIGLSQSGQSPDLIAYLKASHASGALTITMTNDANSPMANLGDLHIPLLVGVEEVVAATKSYSAQLLASLLLVRTWQGAAPLDSNLVALASKLIASFDGAASAMKKLAAAKKIFFIGRGLGYAHAREGALKIQEITAHVVQGLSAADFFHGPIAAVDGNSVVCVIAPAGSNELGLERPVAATRERGAAIVWIGRSDLAKSGDVVIAGADLSDSATNVVIDSSIIQLLAREYAIAVGCDPDTTPGLTKITLTE